MVHTKQALRKEIEVLIGEYGTQVISKLVGITERGVQYWVAEEENKLPSGKRAEKVHELFDRHRSGENLRNALESPKNSLTDDFRDKYIASLERENERLQKDLGLSLGEIRHNLLLCRAMVETNQSLLISLLTAQRKTTHAAVAADANKLFSESYKRMKEEGKFSDADR